MMNPSSSSMAPVFNDYHHRSTNLRSKILKNEEQRVQLEQKLRSMSNVESRSHQRRQIQHIQTYFTRLNQESQRAEQRNLTLLNDLTHAQQHLDKLHLDSEHLTRLKNDYLTYLESNYPNWQRPTSTRTSTNIDSSNEYDRLVQHVKQQQNHLESDGNLRQSGKSNDDHFSIKNYSLFSTRCSAIL
jgi:chromosome segregation ATPase